MSILAAECIYLNERTVGQRVTPRTVKVTFATGPDTEVIRTAFYWSEDKTWRWADDGREIDVKTHLSYIQSAVARKFAKNNQVS